MSLPFDLLLVIASTSVTAWSGITGAIREMHDFAMSEVGRLYAKRIFHREEHNDYRDEGFSISQSFSYFGHMLHSFEDQPAVVVSYDDYLIEAWYYHGKLHRDHDLPAFVIRRRKFWSSYGLFHESKFTSIIDNPEINTDTNLSVQQAEWFQYGQRHREKSPAMLCSQGLQIWYENDQCLRHNALEIDFEISEMSGEIKELGWWNQDKEWRLNDEKHCFNFPAVVKSNGDEYWFKNGLLHRENEPAIIQKQGKLQYWYEEGHLIKCLSSM